MKIICYARFCKLIVSIVLLFAPIMVSAQEKEADDLRALLEDNTPEKKLVLATFKTTRIINGHSIENTPKGVLDLKISHRFSPMGDGVHSFFGLDGATIRIGLDYGLTDRITVGVGRSSLQKEYDGYAKIKLLRQSYGKVVPLSISYVGAMSVTSLEHNQLMGRPLVSPEKYPFSNRLFFVNQLLIARKFNNLFSLQIMPTHVHFNFVEKKSDPNDLFAIGAGARVKVSKRVAINLEYFHQLEQFSNTTNALGIGCDIETGGHVFQLHFSNSAHMTERGFVALTTDKWLDGGFRFGFNIARVFTVVKPKELEGSKNKIW